MNHPDDLLVDHVNGSLEDHERAGVDTHLAGCARCREEVAMARAARAALTALPIEEMPAQVTQAILREATAEPTRSGPPAWYRWAGVAAAAAVVALIAVTLPTLGNGTPDTTIASEGTASTAGADQGVATPTLPPNGRLVLEVSDIPLTLDSVQKLAFTFRSASTAEDGQVEATPTSPAIAAYLGDLRSKPEGTEAALDCLHRAFEEALTAEPSQLIEATYEGKRVYVGVALSGPGAGLPPDTVNVWIAAKADCSVVDATFVKLGG